MRALLKGFGAKDEDFETFADLYSDPTKALDPANSHKYANTANNIFTKFSNDASNDEVYSTREILPLVPVRIDDDYAFTSKNGGLR